MYEIKVLAYLFSALLKLIFPYNVDENQIGNAVEYLEQYRSNQGKIAYSNYAQNNSGIKLSILVPVYNADSFLNECLVSLINQKTNYSYEIIVINDGSDDGSADILKQYSHCSNIRIYSQQNCGIAATRNRLLDFATGEYVMFVDSDDILISNAIEVLLAEAISNNVDMIEGSYIIIGENSQILETRQIRNRYLNSTSDILTAFNGYPWGKLFRRSLFKEARFITGLEFEDTLFPFVIYPQAKHAKTISNFVYKYRINSTSISNTFSKDFRGIDTVWVLEKLIYLRNLLNLSWNDDLYKILLFQIGPMSYSRLQTYDSNILKASFVYFADMLSVFPNSTQLNPLQKLLVRSLHTHNFGLYISCCRLWGTLYSHRKDI